MVDVPVSLRACAQCCRDISASTRNFRVGGMQGWDRVLVPHTWVQVSAAVHVPTLSAPRSVLTNPHAKARVGAVGTLAEQRGDKISAIKSLPCTDSGSAAQPTWQDTRGWGEPHEGVSLCLCS